MIAIVGATGRVGTALCRALAEEGRPYRPVVREPARWAATGLPGTPVAAGLEEPDRLRAALDGASVVVSCAHARHTPAILAAAPSDAKLVLVGSTRRFSAFPDAHGNGVRAGETAFLASGRPGVMLHPTMIYGGPGEQNVQRLARLLRWLPLAPLPGGGRVLVQPIHLSDVARCLVAAIDHPWTGPQALVIAGPDALPYREFLNAVAHAAGLRAPPVVNLPAGLLRRTLPLLGRLPFLPRVTGDEIQRLTEDKAFSIGPMSHILQIRPISLDEGLRRTFAPKAHDYLTVGPRTLKQGQH